MELPSPTFSISLLHLFFCVSLCLFPDIGAKYNIRNVTGIIYCITIKIVTTFIQIVIISTLVRTFLILIYTSHNKLKNYNIIIIMI